MSRFLKKAFPKKILLSLVVAAACFSAGCSDIAGNAIPIDAASVSQTVVADVSEYIDGLYDDYAAYFTPEEYQLLYEENTGSFGGIGVSMVNVDDSIVVYGVIKNTPAAKSPIAEGDVILSVDGVSLAGKDSAQAATLIRGEEGSKVTLQLRKAATNKEYQVTLVRAIITTETVAGYNLPAYPDTAYIRISSFTGQTATDFTNLYNELYADRPIKNLILDLRSNGGGNFYASIAIGEYFVPINEIVVSEKTSSGMEEYRSTNGQLNGLNVVILQNAYTASASEVLIGAIRDQGQATLIGNTTFGKGITQGIGALESGSGHRYTRSIYYTPSGFSLHGVGLAPDIEIADPENATYDSYFSLDPAKNPHLKAALDYLFPDGPPVSEENTADEAGTENSDTQAEGNEATEGGQSSPGADSSEAK